MNKKEYHEQAYFEIQKKKEVKQQQIIKKAIKAINENIKNNKKENWQKVSEELIDDIYSSLEETLSITLTLVKGLYKISNKKLNIKSLTYQEDNKTLEDRIKSYCESVYLDINLNDTPDDKRLKNYITYNLTRLLDTETMTIHNQAVYQLIKDKAVWVEIENMVDHCNEECDIYGSMKRIPIGELDKLPPFHPECRCVVIYYLKNEVKENGEKV